MAQRPDTRKMDQLLVRIEGRGFREELERLGIRRAKPHQSRATRRSDFKGLPRDTLLSEKEECDLYDMGRERAKKFAEKLIESRKKFDLAREMGSKANTNTNNPTPEPHAFCGVSSESDEKARDVIGKRKANLNSRFSSHAADSSTSLPLLCVVAQPNRFLFQQPHTHPCCQHSCSPPPYCGFTAVPAYFPYPY